MDKRKNSRYIGVACTLLVHLCLLALLFWITFEVPDKEEGGMPVVLGVAEPNFGAYDPMTMTDVDLIPEEVDASEDAPVEEADELLTQDIEETVALDSVADLEEEKEKQEKERLEREKKEAEERAERERKAAAEQAAKRIAGAFGKGEKMSQSQKGVQNQMDGANEGKSNGTVDPDSKNGAGGYGTFSLEGRSIGNGGLPRPTYTVQEEGRVVVAIVVNPQGKVILTSIDLKQTNTMNAALRKAAEQAAKLARFNAVKGVDNQSGTITYYFNLK